MPDNQEALEQCEQDRENFETECGDDYELHQRAGLIDGGVDEDGDIEWIGDRRAWDIYSNLSKENI